MAYPEARRGTDGDVHHGERVADPYGWLEDASSPETRRFVEEQNRLAEAWLSEIPGRADLAARVAALWDHPRYGAPFERGGRWFQYRNTGLQPQPVLYVIGAPGDEGDVLVDPNAFSEDGTVALVDAVPSFDGGLLAYATSEAGSDWLTWRVLDVTTGGDLPDVVRWSKFSTAAWRADGSGFYVGAPRRPEEGQELEDEVRGQRVLFHRLGGAAEEVVFAADDGPEWLPHADVTDDGRYLVVSITRGTRPEVRLEVADLDDTEAARVVIGSGFSAQFAVAGSEGRRLFLVTDDGADRGRLVAVDLDSPEELLEVVPESEDVLESARRCGDTLVCCYLRDAQAALRVHALDGRLLHEIEVPAWSSLVDDGHGRRSVSGHPGLDLVHFATTSFTDSGSVWAHHLGRAETRLVHAPTASFDAAAYVTERGHARSADGTLVPYFCTHHRDVVADGEVPVLLYGYGGFNVPTCPGFSVQAAVFMERGGAFVVANLRGGGEFGRAWHDGGRLAHKQHVFDDFLGVADDLVRSGWTRPEQIALIGASNGGLLVGACLTQHPEAFGAAVAEVGVLDMLRFDRFTIGWAWTSDFGDPGVPEQYRWLRAYSPLHNVRERAYPATLLMTGDHDDRVVPAHSYKFAAALQAAQRGDAPVLLRVETAAGHGAGKPTAKQIGECTDVLTFLEGVLGPSLRPAVPAARPSS